MAAGRARTSLHEDLAERDHDPWLKKGEGLVTADLGDDYPADPTTTGVLSLGGAAAGTFETDGDIDWFAITLTAGQAVMLSGPAWLSGLLFYDANGDPVEVDFFREFDDGQQSAGFTATASGTYYVGVSGAAGTYSLSAALSPGNPNDVNAFPQLPNGEFNGYLFDSSTVHWFQVQLSAGETAHLHAWQLSQQILFFDAFGNQIAGASGQSTRYLTATEDGTYYIAISAPHGGGYNFRGTIVADDVADGIGAYGGSVEPMGVLVVDGPAAQFRPDYFDDTDAFAIELTSGQSIEIIVPWWVGVGWFNSVNFYDSAGNPVEVDFFNVTTGFMTGDTQSAGMTAGASGTYYVVLNASGVG